MGGPEGVTGQPSTWITQLAKRLLRHTEDPGWLARWLTPTLPPPPKTQTHTHSYKIHVAQGEVHTVFPCISLWLSVTHTLQDLSGLVASALSGHMTPCWIQSAVLSVRGAHTGRCCFPLGRRGACCPSSVISSSLPPAISVPSALSALPPLLVSSHMATTPIPHPLCHPLDSFPMPQPPPPHWSFTDSSKCTAQPQDHHSQSICTIPPS